MHAKIKAAVFGTQSYDRNFLEQANRAHRFQISYFEASLNPSTCKLAHQFDVVCVFVNDELSRAVIEELWQHGTKLIALRCSGFNNVDLKAAEAIGMKVCRVPAYSPAAVAEHAVALMLALNRKIYRSHNRVRESNFSLEGLLGFSMEGLTAGIVGTGAIGRNVIRILQGFGMKVVAHDPFPNEDCRKMGVQYVDLNELYAQSDIISLHLPLARETYHLIGKEAIGQMKTGVMLINTSRGALIDTREVIRGLKSGRIGYLGLDVYEEEGDLFFQDLSNTVIQDDVFARLLTFPNVVISAHQAFFTREALTVIAETTLKNIADFFNGGIDSRCLVTLEHVK